MVERFNLPTALSQVSVQVNLGRLVIDIGC